jgi:RNA polymerase-binding transcription factor DksA
MTTLEPASLPRSTRVNHGRLAGTLQRFRRECEEQLRLLTDAGPTVDVVAIAHRASVRRTLVNTEAALRRVEGAASGRCLECGGEIAVERRQAVPYAGCCVRCAQRSLMNR